MKNIVFLRRLQTDQEWTDDCHYIAHMILEKSGLEFPHFGYNITFIQLFAEYIENEFNNGDYAEEITDMLEQVCSYGADEVYAYTQDEDIPYINIDTNVELINKIYHLLISETKEFYTTVKPEISNYIERRMKKEEHIILIPQRFYAGILSRVCSLFNKRGVKVYHCSHNNNDQCLEEITSDYNLKDYKITPEWLKIDK